MCSKEQNMGERHTSNYAVRRWKCYRKKTLLNLVDVVEVTVRWPTAPMLRGSVSILYIIMVYRCKVDSIVSPLYFVTKTTSHTSGLSNLKIVNTQVKSMVIKAYTKERITKTFLYLYLQRTSGDCVEDTEVSLLLPRVNIQMKTDITDCENWWWDNLKRQR